jgi:hypothetical protein
MPLVLAIFAAIPALIGLITMIVNAIKKTPAEQRKDFLDGLNDAMKKASDAKNKDPSSLSDIVNKL